MSTDNQLPLGKRRLQVLARGLILAEGHLLLARFLKGGFYFLPGGHVEIGEASPEALKRELREEIVNFPEPTAIKYAGLFEHEWNQNEMLIHELNLIWAVQLSSDFHACNFQSAEPHLEFHWVSIADLNSSGLKPEALVQHIVRWLSNPGEPIYGCTLPIQVDIR